MIDSPWIPTQKPLFVVRMCINKRLNTDRLPSCGGRGSRGLADLLERMVLAEGIPAQILRGPCMNNCLNGPNLKIEAGEYFSLQGDLSDGAVERIMDAIRAEAARRTAMAAAPPAMMPLAIIAAAAVALIIGLAFLLPCQACAKRRERMRTAYAAWKRQNPDRS